MMPDFGGIRHNASFMPMRDAEGECRRETQLRCSGNTAAIQRLPNCTGTTATQPAQEGCRVVWRKRSKVFHRNSMHLVALSHDTRIVSNTFCAESSCAAENPLRDMQSIMDRLSLPNKIVNFQ
jgi:hypothetical protein